MRYRNGVIFIRHPRRYRSSIATDIYPEPVCSTDLPQARKAEKIPFRINNLHNRTQSVTRCLGVFTGERAKPCAISPRLSGLSGRFEQVCWRPDGRADRLLIASLAGRRAGLAPDRTRLPALDNIRRRGPCGPFPGTFPGAGRGFPCRSSRRSGRAPVRWHRRARSPSG